MKTSSKPIDLLRLLKLHSLLVSLIMVNLAFADGISKTNSIYQESSNGDTLADDFHRLSVVASKSYQDDFDIDAYSYLVMPNGKSELPYAYTKNFPLAPQSKMNSSFTLLPSANAREITANIAGQGNMDMAFRTKDKQHVLALLDWPKYFDGPMMSIVARFDNDKLDVPACYRSVNLINDQRYYYPHWSSMEVKSLANGDFLIGVKASGGDSDGEGSSGWDMIAFLKLTSTCGLSVLHKQDGGWLANPELTNCYGTELDYRFLDEKTAEIRMTKHTCKPSKSKGEVMRKKIKLNLPN